MNTLGLVLLNLWGTAWALASATFTSILYLLGRPFERDARVLNFVFPLFARLVLWSVGVRVRVAGGEHIPRDRPSILMANHESYLDIPALVVAAPGHSLRFVAKRELNRLPFLGWAIALSPNVKIDRSDAKGSMRAIHAGAAALPPGASLAVFPEGTRSGGRGMLPFKKGGFLLAVNTRLPVFPATLVGSGRIWGKSARLLRPGTIEVRFHPPIETKDRPRASIPALMDEVREVIGSGLPGAEPVPGSEGRSTTA